MNGDGQIRRRSRYESRPLNTVGSRDMFRASARNAICLPAVGVKIDRSNGNKRKEDGASHAVELARARFKHSPQGEDLVRKQGRTRDAARLGRVRRAKETEDAGACAPCRYTARSAVRYNCRPPGRQFRYVPFARNSICRATARRDRGDAPAMRARDMFRACGTPRDMLRAICFRAVCPQTRYAAGDP